MYLAEYYKNYHYTSPASSLSSLLVPGYAKQDVKIPIVLYLNGVMTGH